MGVCPEWYIMSQVQPYFPLLEHIETGSFPCALPLPPCSDLQACNSGTEHSLKLRQNKPFFFALPLFLLFLDRDS